MGHIEIDKEQFIKQGFQVVDYPNAFASYSVAVPFDLRQQFNKDREVFGIAKAFTNLKNELRKRCNNIPDFPLGYFVINV